MGWLGWLVVTGRIGRPKPGQIAALVLAVAGGAIAARGNLPVGLVMAAAGLLWLSRKSKKYRPGSGAGLPVDDARMRESLDLLGLPRDADRSSVVDAHRRLIVKNHPDAGGTEALARNINAARDYLLERLPK